MGMGDREKGTWKELESDHSRAVKPGWVGQDKQGPEIYAEGVGFHPGGSKEPLT